MPSVVAEVGSTANNYQVLAKLATGGMAEIFLARGVSSTGVERYVVLKRILRERATDQSFVAMFLEEARLAAQLNHPHVAQVYDIGKLGDSYFFTMEYVHGETVRALLHRARSLRREIPLGNIFTVIANTAAGLHHAHERIGIDGRPLGIVHRDVSPSNLMISYEGSVKVVDFGVAKAENRAQETRSGAVKGKISYLSPEQCRGASVDRRSDLFSLGIVLWEMLTTERLYRRESDFANMHAIVTEPPPPPSTRRPGLSPEVDALSLKLLAKNPDERFQTGDELVEAIEELAARNSAIMSSNALSRFVRELFGQRPEPWVEMEQRESAEGVTVTSEPIPPELIARLDPVDMSLARVKDLSTQQRESMSASQSQQSHSPLVTGPIPPLSQMQTVAQPNAVIPDDLPTLRPRANTDAPDAIPRRHPSTSQPPLSQPIPLAPMRPSTSSQPPINQQRPTMPHAVPPMPGAHLNNSGPMTSYPVVQQAWLGPPVDVQNQAEQQPRSKKVIFAVVGVALLVGIVIAAVAGGGSNKGVQALDAGLAASVSMDASAALAPAIDATVVAEVKVDAAAAPVAVDAAIVVDAAPPDAAETAANVPKLSRSDKIQLAFAEGRFSDAVAACGEGVPTERAAACTLAACQLGETSKSLRWIAKVAVAMRPEIIAKCKAHGVDLAPPRVVRPRVDAGVVDCIAQPMACQR